MIEHITFRGKLLSTGRLIEDSSLTRDKFNAFIGSTPYYHESGSNEIVIDHCYPVDPDSVEILYKGNPISV